MPAEWEVWLAQFAGVLARISAALAFVPLPGLHQSLIVPRVALAFTLSVILMPATMALPASARLGSLSDAVWNLPMEAALGLGAGVAVGWLLEAFTLGMQLVSIQAGYSYASTIDPATQADSGVLLVAGQLAAGLVFVGFGWEREVLRAFALSLEKTPPGTWHLAPGVATLAVQWTSATIALAFRLALPVMSFLLLLDLTLALLGRTQPQMPLINLALPVKMGATLLLLAWQSQTLPAAFGRSMGGLIEMLGQLGVSG